jgi:hypothetical protein
MYMRPVWSQTREPSPRTGTNDAGAKQGTINWSNSARVTGIAAAPLVDVAAAPLVDVAAAPLVDVAAAPPARAVALPRAIVMMLSCLGAFFECAIV